MTRGRPKIPSHVTMSVAIPHGVYRQLHELRLARSNPGAKLPPVGQLVREALARFVAGDNV